MNKKTASMGEIVVKKAKKFPMDKTLPTDAISSSSVGSLLSVGHFFLGCPARRGPRCV
jgi:hypothetical protein